MIYVQQKKPSKYSKAFRVEMKGMAKKDEKNYAGRTQRMR